MSVLGRRTSSQLLASRSVHLRIQPRPANLSESREILRVLQRFGEINTYKYLRYEYHNPADNIALAIYRDANSAQQALNASPIRFALERVASDTGLGDERQQSDQNSENDTVQPQFSSTDGIEELMRPSQLLTHSTSTSSSSSPSASYKQTNSTVPAKKPTRPVPMPFETPTEPPKIVKKWFQVTVDRSRVIHQDYVERQPYWKQFTPTKSMAQEDLAKVVPYVGLSDVSKRPLHHHRTPNRVLKLMSHYVEHVMPSLKDMYEEGGRERK